MARPAESIKSGNYGQPPKITWYLKQLMIYFLGLVGMKLFVFFLFAAMPFLPWIGDWALRWTKGNEALEVTFAMFIFPLIMNVLQYYIIDNFIMDKKGAKQNSGYEQVHGDDDDEERDGDGDDGVTRSVGLDPFGDFGKVFVLLTDVVLFAEVDEVDDWFGGEEEERVDCFNLDHTVSI